MATMRVNPIQLLVLVTVVSLVQCEFKLQLMHTNDMHARFEETNGNSGQCVKKRGPCYGGFARLKTAADHAREDASKEGYETIFLNAGDTYQGTILYTMFRWTIVSDLINNLGIDVMSLGNHEFDDGPQGLQPFLEHSTVPVVCANIDYSEEPELAGHDISKLTKSYVLTVKDVKIGVIGYLTPDTKFLSKTGAVKFEDEITAIKKEVERLKNDGVHILIALGHSGIKVDKMIAEQVPDLDIVVGGHTNTFLYNGKQPDLEKIEGPYPTVVKQSSGREVLVVTAYAYTKYLGSLMVTFDDNGEVVNFKGNPILVDERFKKDSLMGKAVQKYANDVKEATKRTIGTSKTFLEANEGTCRVRECNFGNFVTDAMVHMNAKDYVGEGWTDSPVAFVQGGALRASIDSKLNRGSVTYADLLTTMPFLNSVERLTITGEILEKVMEHSVKKYDPNDRPGTFMQFSGVRVEYDLSRSPGQRVVAAMVRCGECRVPTYFPLDHARKYNVLTTTFLADGGDDYKMLKEASQRIVMSFTDVEAVENYMKERSPIHPEIEGRITLGPTKGMNDEGSSDSSSTSPSLATYLSCLSAFFLFSICVYLTKRHFC